MAHQDVSNGVRLESAATGANAATHQRSASDATASLKQNDVFLTPTEAAHLLTISDRSLREFTKRGTIRAVRLGDRTVRYSRREIERLARAA